ncbi:MAG: hypothetical protein ISN26_06840 [Betaproteobacteria bacterium AqS2]|uniref:Uncharacterized protein n=1 Tax=Candidatus Amphirhobacter heronislandensis TaxID=1732024 RepID=A0A930UIB6_9GAMM|nr:hypothetical protein [Betaproteobacteria bacterium AqS2]
MGNKPFAKWAKAARLPGSEILEPFAGSNSLIKMLAEMGLCRHFKSFDVAPADSAVRRRDTLARFPKGFDVCVTNPPWLAKNSATGRGLPFPACRYDDLYKYALEKCLANCTYVAALVPESFITSGVFLERLDSFVSITAEIFGDTRQPVGLALFGPDETDDTEIWSGKKRVGLLSNLQAQRPQPQRGAVSVRFNDPDGNVGLFALDNTIEPSIRFCNVKELADYDIRPSCRSITKIMVDGKVKIAAWNKLLNEFRQSTHDVLMTSFKGIRKDGKYRRRCDWALARGIIHNV